MKAPEKNKTAEEILFIMFATDMFLKMLNQVKRDPAAVFPITTCTLRPNYSHLSQPAGVLIFELHHSLSVSSFSFILHK